MKKTTSLLGLATCLLVSVLFGAEQPANVCLLAFDGVATGQLYAEDGAVASPKTSFGIECTTEGVWLRFDAEKACDVTGALEVFVQPSLDLPDGNYYQFYTEFDTPEAAFSNADRILLARRGVPGDFHPSLRIYYSYFTERMPGFPYLKDFRTRLTATATGCIAEIFIPWNALARILPFDETGKGKQWRFGAFRMAAGVESVWQGRPHKAPTWGRLVFPDISLDQLAEIYRTIAVQNVLKTEPVIDPTLFDAASIPAALEAQEIERAALEKMIPPAGDKLSLVEMQALAAATDQMRTFREVLATFNAGTRMEWKGWELESVAIGTNGTESVTPLLYTPEHGYCAYNEDGKPDRSACSDGSILAFDKRTQTAKALRLRYVFSDTVAHQARLTDLFAGVRGTAPRSLRCTIALNGEPLGSDHDPVAVPTHLDMPSIGKGDQLVILLQEAEGLPVNFSFFCRVETERFGLIPRAPLNYAQPNPLDRKLPLKKDNEYDMHFANVYAGELSRLLYEKPRVIQFGGWFEIGFQLYAKPRRKELYDKYQLTHVGNISDNNLITNLKLENYQLDTLKPAMIILNASYAFSKEPEEVCVAMKESIRIVREKAPDARIVILGVVPRPRRLESAKTLNTEIAKLAEAEHVPYRDVFPIFLDAEGEVREELFQPVGYMTQEGYRLWTEILISDLESTLR